MWSMKLKAGICNTPVHKAAYREEAMPSHTHPTTPFPMTWHSARLIFSPSSHTHRQSVIVIGGRCAERTVDEVLKQWTRW